MIDDLDDLLGGVGPAEPKRRVGRRTREEVLEALVDRRQRAGGPTQLPRMEEFIKPVGVTFLADVFRLDVRTVKKKLAECPIVRHEGGGKPLYDFVQASGYLVKPKLTGWSWLKSLRVQDLPAHLAPGIQQAMLSRQTFEVRARNLWRTDDVLKVFGEVFLTMKDTIQLWSETLRESSGLTDQQYLRLRELTDDLQNSLHQKLVALPQKQRTPNSLAYADMEVDVGDPFADAGDDEGDE